MTVLLQILALSIQDYRKHASILIGYSSWILLPFVVYVFLSFLPNTLIVDLLATGLAAVEMILALWIMTLLALFTYDTILQGKKTNDTLERRARTFILPLLGIVLFQALIFIGGFFLLIFPIFLFGVWFGLAQFMVLFEHKHGISALSASRELTRGQFWKSALLILVGPIGIFLIYTILLSFLLSIGVSIQQIDPEQLLTNDLPLWMDVVVSIGEMLLIPLFTIYFTRVYIELKSAHLKL